MSSAVVLPEIDEEILEDSHEDLETLYHVILLNDEDHTYNYVIEMLVEIFGFGEDKAYQHTVEVDTHGHTRLATLPLKDAEEKRDKIHAFGPDWRMPRSQGAMAALIEPAA